MERSHAFFLKNTPDQSSCPRVNIVSQVNIFMRQSDQNCSVHSKYLFIMVVKYHFFKKKKVSTLHLPL